MFSYKTKGVCSTKIELQLSEDGTVESVAFTGGCNGNTQGVSRLVVGMKAEEAISRLKGIKCGFKTTSCPDQLSKALELALAEQKK
ncbi:MAG: TIGR03905 family TSCPD domain-containing protein [Oscillospiraceae bacterium]|nr:TIGR03905 family TSCPD domain-containing protein [Oscillospiraceae bacterium]MBQ8732811.1 TIGR03905 family TSCPD domain-containing protein [Oscillospiraceae bacterium]